ncbi:hypothetical protein VV01_21525 [Luteipulveratus halotolerans]|uniref:Transcriptional regulator WhiB n=2 Tax=Luteipulveratus halotolerans TaxID=1631356 RepID=A0A0L6CE62_9MICO|nr:WhiB family transcriptional regulator [Luteipulveratus halotolerans]KNX35954.1 hypothetical protein VV01_21525 [Luteipulveratus halotolerans]
MPALRPSWQKHALCAKTDPETFYPERGQSSAPAERICRKCRVAAECLDYALAHGERFGVWGGTSERRRRRLARIQQEF